MPDEAVRLPYGSKLKVAVTVPEAPKSARVEPWPSDTKYCGVPVAMPTCSMGVPPGPYRYSLVPSDKSSARPEEVSQVSVAVVPELVRPAMRPSPLYW